VTCINAKVAAVRTGTPGAPLEKEEMGHLNDIYEIVKPYLTPAGIKRSKAVDVTITTRNLAGSPPPSMARCAPTASRMKKELSNAGSNRPITMEDHLEKTHQLSSLPYQARQDEDP